LKLGMSRKSLAAGAAAIALLAAPAMADVKAGVDAWAVGDFAGAVRQWQGPADAGDPDAQFNMAQAYKLGRGVPRDLAKAETLYASAAAKGHLQAADNYGLLLFQRGERARALPYIRAAAARGDARAQYVLGLAMFNGDLVEKDWIRAYAYVNLAQQQGLPQATSALAQMDQHIPLADRQKAVALAAQLATETEATRDRQLAAADMNALPGARPAPSAPVRKPTPAAPVDRAATTAANAAAVAREASKGSSGPKFAGADFTLDNAAETKAASRPAKPLPKPTPSPSAPALSAPAPRPAVARPAAAAASGVWRVQLGAFGVPGNAEALWTRVKGRPELAGHGKLLVPTGKVTKLQAGGFASQADAASACAKLKAGGLSCLVARD